MKNTLGAVAISAALFSVGASADFITPNLITNSEFRVSDTDHTASLNGWTVTHGSPQIISSGGVNTVRGGASYENYSAIRQMIDLTNFNFNMSALHSGDVQWDFDATLRSYQGKDYSRVRLAFYDSEGTQLDFETLDGATALWGDTGNIRTTSNIRYSFSGYVPYGAVTAGIFWSATRTYGSGNNGYMNTPDLNLTVPQSVLNTYGNFKVPTPFLAGVSMPLLGLLAFRRKRALSLRSADS